jgi:hypothetical protein
MCPVCLPAAAGASYEVTDPDKGNPAQIAAYWGHLEAVVKLVEAGCSWPHGKTARGVAGGDVVKWICNITTNKVRQGGSCCVESLLCACPTSPVFWIVLLHRGEGLCAVLLNQNPTRLQKVPGGALSHACCAAVLCCFPICSRATWSGV